MQAQIPWDRNPYRTKTPIYAMGIYRSWCSNLIYPNVQLKFFLEVSMKIFFLKTTWVHFFHAGNFRLNFPKLHHSKRRLDINTRFPSKQKASFFLPGSLPTALKSTFFISEEVNCAPGNGFPVGLIRQQMFSWIILLDIQTGSFQQKLLHFFPRALNQQHFTWHGLLEEESLNLTSSVENLLMGGQTISSKLGIRWAQKTHTWIYKDKHAQTNNNLNNERLMKVVCWCRMKFSKLLLWRRQ